MNLNFFIEIEVKSRGYILASTSFDYQLPGCPEKRTICNRCCY